MSSTISVRPDELAGLGACLTALGGQMDDAAELCRLTGATIDAALGGDEAGWRLGAVASTWGALAEILADQCRSLGTTFLAAVESYRDVDAGLAGRVAAAVASVGRIAVASGQPAATAGTSGAVPR